MRAARCTSSEGTAKPGPPNKARYRTVQIHKTVTSGTRYQPVGSRAAPRDAADTRTPPNQGACQWGQRTNQAVHQPSLATEATREWAPGQARNPSASASPARRPKRVRAKLGHRAQ